MRIMGRYFLWHRHLLLNSSEIQPRTFTRESKERSALILAQVEREIDRISQTDEEFLYGLGLKLKCSELVALEDSEKIRRCVELTNRTNQWNSTGQGTNPELLRKFIEQEGRVLCFSAADKFSNYGEICFISLIGRQVTQFVMSFRVAGLHLESAILRFIMSYLETRTLEMCIVETEKNSPIRLFCERFPVKNGIFCISENLINEAKHVSIFDNGIGNYNN
jgi:FkbH-like protein